MRMTKGWTGLRTAVIALGLVAWTATGANAAALTYQTVTSMGPSGIQGANVINFIPTTGSVDLSGGASNAVTGEVRGRCRSPRVRPRPIPTHRSTSPSCPQSMDGTSASAVNPIVFSGYTQWVDHRRFHVDRRPRPSIRRPNPLVTIGNETLTLGVPNGALSLVPSSVQNGETTAQTQILASGAGELPRFPSPAPIALFFTTLGGLGLRRYVQTRRRQASV